MTWEAWAIWGLFLWMWSHQFLTSYKERGNRWSLVAANVAAIIATLDIIIAVVVALT